MSEMPENSDGYVFSGGDFVFVMTALEALREDLQGLMDNEETRANTQWHIELVDSTMSKIENRATEFSEDECRVMYIAGLEMRDLMNKILDNKSVTEYDREMARTTLQSANGMLRMLRKTFSENGIDVNDLIPS